MKICLVRDVTAPTRGTAKSAGIDLYIPKINDSFIRDFNQRNGSPQHMAFIDGSRKQVCIHPNGQVFIPTGIMVDVPEGYALFVKNKGGVSWGDRVTKVAEVIDEDFQGEVFISMANYTSFKTTLQEGQKFIQLVLMPVFYDKIEIVKPEEIHLLQTERGAGAMGSSGK
jgi:dUTP pyrophosphatase